MVESAPRPESPFGILADEDTQVSPPRLGQAVRQGLVYQFGSIASQAIGFLMIPVYTRFLTRSDYGVSEVLFQTANILMLVLAANIPAAVMRFYYEYEDPRDRNEVISTGLVFTAVAAVILFGALALTPDRLARLAFGVPQHASLMALVLVSCIFSMVFRVPVTVLRARERAGLYTWVSMLQLALGLGLNILFVVVLTLRVRGIVYSALLTPILLSAVLAPPLVRRVGLRVSLPKLKRMLAWSLPLVVAGLPVVILHSGDRFILQRLADSDTVGIYSLGYKFGMVVAILINNPLGLAWEPHAYRIAGEAGANRVYARILTYYIVGAGAMALALSLFAREIVALMADPRFLSAYRVVPLVSCGYLFFGAANLVRMVLLIEHKTPYVAIATASAAALNVTLNLLLVPRMGMMGAALATCVSFGAMLVVSYGLVRRIRPIPYELGRIGAAVGLGIAVFLCSTLVPQEPVLRAVALKLLLFAAFPLILWRAGFFRPEELDAVQRMTRRLSPFLLPCRGYRGVSTYRATPPAVSSSSATFRPPPDNPCVSVVIPTYNRAHLLADALASVANQTLPVLETIVVDDGSNDDTPGVVARFPSVKLLHTPRLGPAAARNAGIAMATGELVAFLDSDDIWLPGKIACQTTRLRAHPEAALVYCDSVAWDGQKVVDSGTHRDYAGECDGWCYPQLVMRNPITCSTAMVRTACLRATGGFVSHASLRMGEDWLLWLTLARQYPVTYVPEVLVHYRVHAGQVIRNAAVFEQSVEYVLQVVYGDPTAPEEVRRLMRRRLGLFRTDVARQHYLEGNLGPALLNALRAFLWWPLDGAPLLVGAKAVMSVPLQGLARVLQTEDVGRG